MVSIRRPPSSSFRAHSHSSWIQSLCTVRNAILLVIVVQSVHLVWKVVMVASPSSSSTKKLIDASPLKPDIPKGSIKAPKPPVHVEQIPEDHPHERPLVISDHDSPDNHDDKQLPIQSQPIELKPTSTKAVEISHGDENAVLPHGLLTGPTRSGFVVNLVQLRNQAPFRLKTKLPTADSNLPRIIPVVKSSGGDDLAASLKPCMYHTFHTNGSSADHHAWMEKAACRIPDTPLVAYNTAPFSRYWCGQEIPPGGTLYLPKPCHDKPFVFADNEDPPVSFGVDGHVVSLPNIPPLQVQRHQDSTKGTPSSGNKRRIDCDVPCQWDTNIDAALQKENECDLTIPGTPWIIHHSVKDPYTYASARVERIDFRRDHYYSTTSFQSSVPVSFYSFEKYNFREAPKATFEQLAPKATYLINDECSSTAIRRPKWFAAVHGRLPTEAYGKCEHNTDLKNGETISTFEGRIKLYQKNRIALAFEAGNEKDHITSIVWEALMSGVVPAILGSTNLWRHLPPRSAIFSTDFNSWDKFAEFVRHVAQNKTLWESYHTWRTNEKALRAFEELYDFTRTSIECRTCRWAYAKMYGLGWNHQQQRITRSHSAHTLCLDQSTKLATKPFKEVWVDSSKPHFGHEEQCIKNGVSDETTIQVRDSLFRRTIVHRHGVTDMEFTHIQDASDRIVLQISVGLENAEGAFFRDTHTLIESDYSATISSASMQDNYAKVTVLANWKTVIHSPREGIMEVMFDPSASSEEARRIRIITEEVNPLHDKLTEFFFSSFGKMLVKDFIDPLELYYHATNTTLNMTCNLIRIMISGLFWNCGETEMIQEGSQLLRCDRAAQSLLARSVV